MKYLFGLILSLFVVSYVQSQPTTRVVSSKITKVLIFQQGAQVERTAKVNLHQGLQRLEFHDLPEGLNRLGIQVMGQGDFQVVSVNHSINHLSTQGSKVLKKITDSVEIVKENLQHETMKKAVYDEKLEVLRANRVVKGDGSTLSLQGLKLAMDFFGEQTGLLIKGQYTHRKNIEELQRTLTKLEEQLRVGKLQFDRPTTTITVEVFADKPKTSALLNLLYIVQNAGWQSSYDVRVQDITSPLEFVYKAQVEQNTGEDWNEVELHFSTGNLMLTLQKPNLYPQYLEALTPRPYAVNRLMAQASTDAEYSESAENFSSTEMGKATRGRIVKSTEVKRASVPNLLVGENSINVEYRASLPYTILSGAEIRTVELTRHTLTSKYTYATVPKLDTKVFLVSEIDSWENLNLFSGTAALYLGENYVGSTFINTREIKDTLSLSLGSDANITVQRERGKNYKSKSLFGNTRTEEREWVITVKNNKQIAINLVLEDQIPISSQQGVVVEALELSGGALNSETGSVKWIMPLEPGQTKAIVLKYSVKYPKNLTFYID